jgi:hypothetical protein
VGYVQLERRIILRDQYHSSLDERGSGTKWCEKLDDLEMMREYIKALPLFALLAETKARQVEITHSYV